MQIVTDSGVTIDVDHDDDGFPLIGITVGDLGERPAVEIAVNGSVVHPMFDNERENHDDSVVITPETLLEWAGPLTVAQVARLAEVIQHSSVPDAIGEVAYTVRLESDDHGWSKGNTSKYPFWDDDAGDVGGDIQAGPAHSLLWQRALADGTYESLTLYHFAATNDPALHDAETESWSAWVETMVELVRHRDANDIGGSQILADSRFESRVSFPTLREALDAARRFTSDNEDLDPHTLWWQI